MTTSAMPDKIGRYQILERVGRGGMGVLYRGFDPVLDREVAVKVMLADFSEDAEQMRPRFYREARSAAKLQHRNIVTVFEFAEEQNQPHIVMEFLRGSPLSSRMEEPPPLTLDDKLDIVAQLCTGLGYAHSQGVVHRDVKPANVFILQDGTVKLLDFGIAKLATSTLTRQGDVVGSAPYMSPEQIAGAQDLDGRSDVWSTGVLLYELLTGRKPFRGDGLTTIITGILKDDPPPIDQLVPGIPAVIQAVVAKALAKDRDKRYQSAEELGRELQLIRKTQPLAVPAPMDETRFASTNVLKALHEDRQKQGGTPADKTLQQPPPAAAAPAKSFKESTPLLIACALIAAAAVAGLYFLLKPTPSAPAQTITANPATVAASQPVQPSAPPVAPPPVDAKTTAAEPPAASPTPVTKKEAPAKKSTAPAQPATAVAVPPAPVAARANVAVSMSAAYEFEVLDGTRVISPMATTHELPLQANGKTLRVHAENVFLDQPVKVDGGADQKFDFSPPGLGRIVLRAVRGDCKAMLGKNDLGVGPWPKPIPAAAGDYQITLVCPDGQNPIRQFSVAPGVAVNVFFQK